VGETGNAPPPGRDQLHATLYDAQVSDHRLPLLRSVGVLLQRDAARRILGNSGWLLGDRIARVIVSLSVGVLVARYLGPARLGMLSYATALVGIVGCIGAMGTEGVLTRDLVREPQRAYELLGSALVLRFVGGVAVVIVAALLATWLRADSREIVLMVVILAAGSLLSPMDVVDQWFQSRVESKYSVMARGMALLTASALRIVLVIGTASVVMFAWAQLFEAVLAAVALMVAYRLTGNVWRRWRVNWCLLTRLMRDSWPLILSGLMTMTYMRIDQVMLGTLADDHTLGIYSVSVRLTEVWYFVPWVLISSTLPSIVRAAERSEFVLRERSQQLYNAVSFISYAIAVPVSLLAGVLVDTLYGSEYAASAPVLVLLIWTVHLTSLGMARSSYLVAKNWTRLHLATVGVGAVVNVVMNVVLIPKHGAIGAAVATLVSYWVAVHGSCFLFPTLVPTGKMLARALAYPRVW
jgi:O-antigen/teichoic acid export membrane protein